VLNTPNTTPAAAAAGAGIVNTSLSYVGPSGSFCPGDSLAQVEAQGAACKAEVRR
jgi:hypothetical protein